MSTVRLKQVVGLASCLAGLLAADASADDRLPFPEEKIPVAPSLLPVVVTAGGQRRFLSEFPDLRVGWDGMRFFSNYKNWWIVNYPLDRVVVKGGGDFDAAARERAFGPKPVRNWYLRVPGEARPEPAPADRPAPIELTPNPTIIVDPSGPVKTLAAALKRAKTGDVIRVKYGIYREGGLLLGKDRVTVEGERNAAGDLPVMSGNRLFPANAWTKSAWPGVWRAPIFTEIEGSVSLDGRKLRERDLPETLVGDDFCSLRASETFAQVREPPKGLPFKRVTTGVLGKDFDLSDKKWPKGCVRFACAWVWIDPKHRKKGEVWDPNAPLPVSGRLDVKGCFRIGRQNGSRVKSQPNAYRLRVNGDWITAYENWTLGSKEAGRAHATLEYGKSDRILGFKLREGWNRLEFVFDTTRRPDETTFGFGLPKGIEQWAVSAKEPVDWHSRGETAWTDHLSELSLSAPVAPGESSKFVYLKLADGTDPNRRTLDLSFVGTVLSVTGNFCRVRGLEFRHGSQFQQCPLVGVGGEGNVIEFCQATEPMVKGFSLSLAKNQLAAPNVLRGCRVIRPGNTGIGAASDSKDPRLTRENQSTTAESRSRCIIEYNYICDNNWGAHQALWESGGIKVCNLTGCVIRYNTIERGYGPGIWMDWQHYNNRIEGNLGLDGWGFLVGIEASCGPNLVCNNVAIGQRPGSAWFRSPFLAWSTGKYWCLCNTVDGKFNADGPAWHGKLGGGGIDMNGGGSPADRHTRWLSLKEDRGNVIAANVVTNLTQGPCAGVGNPVPERLKALVKHDFYGLLRAPDDTSVGAFRASRPGGRVELEVERE